MPTYRTRNRDYKVEKVSEKTVKRDSDAFLARLKHLKKLRKEKSVPQDVLNKKWKDALKASKRLEFRRRLIDGRNKKGHSGN